jgi:transcriptional regulator with XRE-family HTH domain
MQVVSRIRELRQAKGLTQRQLAQTLGVTVRSLQVWERGDGMTAFVRVAVLCSLLECGPLDLVEIVDEQ